MSNNTAILGPLLVDAKKAAALLGVSRALFYQMQNTGKLGPRSIRFGRKRLWSVSQLQSWVDAGCPDAEQWQRVKESL